MKIGNLKDWLEFVNKVAVPAEEHLRERGIQESDWPALSRLSESKETHLGHMVGTHDPILIRTALEIIYLREQCRLWVNDFSADPEKAAAQLAALAWGLHMLSTALHAEPLEMALIHRPDRQAKRRKGKYGLNRRVLEVAYDEGATDDEKGWSWLEGKKTLDLVGGQKVNISFNKFENLFEMSGENPSEETNLNIHNIRTTLRNIKKSKKKKTS